MSTPTNSGSASKGKSVERGSLGKYVKRMSTVFKRDRSSKSQAPAPAPDAPAPSASGGQAQQAQPVQQQTEQEQQQPPPPPPPPPPPQQEPQPPQPSAQDQSANDAPATTTTTVSPTPVVPHVSAPPAPVTKTLDRNAMQQERARALFAKYGLTLESHEWIAAPRPMPALERVEKPIRMRVHRSCHRCGTLYGADRTCVECDHRRCKKCPRFPKKKTPEEKLAEKDVVDQPKRKRMLTIRTRAGGELVYQPTKQRIRRTCHVCSTVFIPAQATICQNCQHQRCTKCPREPAKLTKWPAGYPGDAEPDSETEMDRQLETFRRTWRKPRTRVRWQCDKCGGLFLNHSPQCSGCGHERCDQCIRSPVKKPKKTDQFDAQVVAAVEAKLRAIGIDDGPSSAAEAT